MARSLDILLVLGAASGLASAQGQWRLIDRDLNTEVVELTRIAGGEVSFVDRDGAVRREAVGELLAVVHETPAADRPPRELPWITRQLQMFGQDDQAEADTAERFVGALELTDGQRWVGQLVGGGGQSITWLIEDTLLLDAPLEQVQSASLLAPLEGARASWRGLDDRLVLVNGDVLDGFLDAFGQSVEFEYDGKATTIPAGGVAGLLLANPPARPSGILLRTEGGSVVSVADVEVTLTGQVSAEAGGATLLGSLGLRTSELAAIDFAPNSYAGLASIEPSAVSTPGGAPWAAAPRALDPDPLGVRSLELRGPLVLEWELPGPAARFAATVTLPPAMWAWGDCEVIVRTADGREAFRQRLRAAQPTAEINIPLGGMRGLVVEVAPGEGGPVQDTVVLERPIVAWR